MQLGCLEGGSTYRGGSDTTVLEFFGWRGSFWSFNELEFALRAIDALGFGRHDCRRLSRIKENESLQFSPTVGKLCSCRVDEEGEGDVFVSKDSSGQARVALGPAAPHRFASFLA